MASSLNSPANTPPGLIQTLLAGFDTITNHLYLLLLPILLDAFLWLGPRLSIKRLIDEFLAGLPGFPGADDPQMRTLLEASAEVWRIAGEQINLFSMLRTYPFGLPSLMAGEFPQQTPFGGLLVWQTPDWMVALMLVVAISLIGLAGGAMYFALIGFVVGKHDGGWSEFVRRLPVAYLRVVFITILWLVLLFALSLPASLLVSLASSLGNFIGPLILAGGAVFLLYAALPLVFILHGTFLDGRNMRVSIRYSIRMVQLTLPRTALFMLCLVLIDQGMDVVWRIAGADSWLSLLSIAGHAFIGTALIAATFVYFRDTESWLQGVLAQRRQSLEQI